MTKRFVANGHLIDSGILPNILNIIVEEGAEYHIIDFQMGKTNLETSHIEFDLFVVQDRGDGSGSGEIRHSYLIPDGEPNTRGGQSLWNALAVLSVLIIAGSFALMALQINRPF